MIKIEKLYGGSMKEAGIFLATLALFFHLLNLIFMDFTNNSYLLHSDLKDNLGRSVVFYSLVVGTILAMLAALSFLYGIINARPYFMLPILIVLPICPLLKLIYLVTWFAWIALVRFIISIMIIPYSWVCFYVNWHDLRRKTNKIEVQTNMTEEEETPVDVDHDNDLNYRSPPEKSLRLGLLLR